MFTWLICLMMRHSGVPLINGLNMICHSHKVSYTLYVVGLSSVIFMHELDMLNDLFMV